MAKKTQTKSKRDSQLRPTEEPDLPPGQRYNLPPIRPESVTTQNLKDLEKKPANQTQA